jgi:uncharacterized metal-binding protein
MLALRANITPLVYSCSGCSSAAQMANWIALQLDREGTAEMSCIAGVGGNVPKLVRIARSGRMIVAIDGCQLACARHCLRNCGVEPARHIILSSWGVPNRYRTGFDLQQAAQMLDRTRRQVIGLSGLPQEARATPVDPNQAA